MNECSFKVPEGPQQPQPSHLVGVGDRDQLRERLGTGPTNERAQQRVPRGLKPVEHVLKLAQGIGTERSET